VDRRRGSGDGVHAAARLRAGRRVRIQQHQLGLVAEKIDGKPLADVLQDRLFGPLGMDNTALPAAASNLIPEPFAHGYLYGGTSYALADAPYPEDLVAAARAGTLEPNDDTWQNPSAYFAAGGVISTADDLATWMRALVGGKVFNAEFQKQWLSSPDAPVLGAPAMQKYGYGIITISWGSNVIYYQVATARMVGLICSRRPENIWRGIVR
jgi:D-alanyl-D-alanine carboxypeptidase